MKEIHRKKGDDCPYYLHDTFINQIICKKKNVKFVFDKGYFVKGNEDCIPVQGNIEFQNVDYYFCCVYVLDIDIESGKISGRQYPLKKFVKKYPELKLEITDETYYYNKSRFSGIMHRKWKKKNRKKVREFIIELYHSGDMVYITE